MGGLPLDEQQFWDVIGPCGAKALTGLDRQVAGVRKRLKALTPAEVLKFDRLFHQKMVAAYTWDLWGAAYLINGGCSGGGVFFFLARVVFPRPQGVAEAAPGPDPPGPGGGPQP